jgi:diacylglycerol kinase (ATP)
LTKLFANVIVNPAAGANSTRHKWPGLCSLLKKVGLPFDFQFTEGKGHAIELARDASEKGYRYVVAVGGDGTVHEVANGIMQKRCQDPTSLGIICTGTGGDLSRSLGISHNYNQACNVLANPREITLDIGRVEYQKKGQTLKRYFINSAGIGFDAKVAEATEQLPKYFGGTLPYLAGLIRSFLFYRNKEISFKVGDQPEQKTRILSLVVANGRYFGGGMLIAPEAKLDDNLLDIVVLGNFGKIELLQNLKKVYAGTHLSHPKVKLVKDKRIVIQSKQSFLLHADGEILGEGPVSFSLLPKALTVLV